MSALEPGFIFAVFLCMFFGTFLTAYALSPFKVREFVKPQKTHFLLSDALIVVLQMGASGTVIFNIQVFPDIEFNIVLMLVAWLLIAGIWFAAIVLMATAGITRPFHRILVIVYILPITLLAAFGPGYLLIVARKSGSQTNWLAGWVSLALLVSTKRICKYLVKSV